MAVSPASFGSDIGYGDKRDGTMRRRGVEAVVPVASAVRASVQPLDSCLLPCSGQLSAGGAAPVPLLGPCSGQLSARGAVQSDHSAPPEREHTEDAVPAEEGSRQYSLEGQSTVGLQILSTVRRIEEQLMGMQKSPAAAPTQLFSENTTTTQLVQEGAGASGTRTEQHIQMELAMARRMGPPHHTPGAEPHIQVELAGLDARVVRISDASSLERGSSMASSVELDHLPRGRMAVNNPSQRSSQHIYAPAKHRRRNPDSYTTEALRQANVLEAGPMDSRRFSAISWLAIPNSKEAFLDRFRQANARRLLKWNGFDVCIGWVILLNSVCIGWEIDMSARGDVSARMQTTLRVLENSFLAIYTGELFLRLFVDGLPVLKNSWVFFDCLLVGSGLVAALIHHIVQPASDGALKEVMEQVMLFRVIRLLRLVRALRLVRQFKTLWRLVKCLLTSLDTMLSTLALVALVLYVAACIGVELISGNQALNANPEIKVLIEAEYNSVLNTMLSLVQFVTLDDLGDLYKPIVREQPLTCVYFVTILMIVPIALLNLVTAVLVEGALENARKDSELEAITLRRKVKQFLPIAQDLFRRMDTEDYGVITLAEIQQKLEEGTDRDEIKRQLKEIIPFDSIVELFESLDVDGNGELAEQEFVDGVLKSVLAGHNNTELTQIMRLLRVYGRKLEKMDLRLAEYARLVNSLATRSSTDFRGAAAPTPSSRVVVHDASRGCLGTTLTRSELAS